MILFAEFGKVDNFMGKSFGFPRMGLGSDSRKYPWVNLM